MKYRILEKTVTTTIGQVPNQVFFAQKKVWYWPFWLYIVPSHCYSWEIEEAKRHIIEDKVKNIKYPKIIHEIKEDSLLDKAEKLSKLYP